jgi:hypothetical protein
MSSMLDHQGNLFLGQPVALDHGGIVRREQPGRLSQGRQNGRRDGQILDGLPGRLDPH